MKKPIFLLVLISAAGVVACATQKRAPDASGEHAACTTAIEVIDRHLEAVGGRDRLRNIDTLVLKGSVGSALLPSGQKISLYLKKPDKLKQESAFQVTLCNDGRFIFNNGEREVPLPVDTRQNIMYRIGFFRNAFSLLNWEEAFPAAKLEEQGKYGSGKQYGIRFPSAENGRDLIAYLDAETFLIDRLVYTIDHPEARELRMVNRLRDFEEHHGLWIPTRVIFDKIGWEEGPIQFLIEDMEINPPLESDLFESAEVDFGNVACEGDTVRGEIFGDMDGWILTNIRPEDLTSVGIEDTDWLDLRVGDASMKVKYLNNIQRSATEIKPEQVYLCRYPISGFPRLQIVCLGQDTLARIPCEKGDSVVLTRIVEKENQENR